MVIVKPSNLFDNTHITQHSFVLTDLWEKIGTHLIRETLYVIKYIGEFI